MFLCSFKINNNLKETIKTEILSRKKNWKKDLNNVKALTSGFFPNYLFFDILKEQLSDKLFIHSHQPEHISSIIFIKTDDTNPLYFNLNPGILRVEEEEGLILLFDSRIAHGVDFCKNSRITLAMDFVMDN